MNKIIALLAKHTLGRYLVAPLALLHDKLDGRKSEIVAGLVALVHILKLAGIIPPELATSIEQGLLPLLPLVLADRASKVLKTVDSVVPEAPKE